MSLYQILLLFIVGISSVSAKEVRIYSERHYPADKTIFAKFTKETGIDVRVVKAGANELIARMKSEKQSPQADLYVAVDAAALGRASAAGLLEKIESPTLLSPILNGLVPADHTWIPLTMRARVIVYSKDRVKQADAPKTYADLADPKWRGNILIRSSSSHYNQSLLASILADQGKGKAMAWAAGVKKNMARAPQGGDRDQVRGVALGLGDIAVTNSYYLGVLENSDDAKDRAARAAVGVIFPNQKELGTHVNISGAGIIKGSTNQKEALQLLQFITSPENQALYQKLTSEFSVVKGIEREPLQKSWGDFKPDFVSLHKLLKNYEEAVKIFDIVGWQ